MQPISDIKTPSQRYIEDIDRVIHASRIEGMRELKNLIRFINHLIQAIFLQINSGNLSSAGAKIKIMHLLNLVGHCQIGNHPTIKSRLDKLRELYTRSYQVPLEQIIHPFKPLPQVLAAASIRHYVESIFDSQNDPIYSERPLLSAQPPAHIQRSPIESTAPITNQHGVFRSRLLPIPSRDQLSPPADAPPKGPALNQSPARGPFFRDLRRGIGLKRQITTTA